jgi:hypothetical protein
MGQYIDLNISQDSKGFTVDIHNQSNHALFGQALRQGVLKASIERDGKEITLEPFIFTRILAKEGKEAMPWDADGTLKDTLLYENKKIHFNETLQKGDVLTLTLGVQLLTKKGAKALGLEKNNEVNKFRVLKTKQFKF